MGVPNVYNKKVTDQFHKIENRTAIILQKVPYQSYSQNQTKDVYVKN